MKKTTIELDFEYDEDGESNSNDIEEMRKLLHKKLDEQFDDALKELKVSA